MESRFTANLLEQIGINIFFFIISIITLGLGIPWAVCMVKRWDAKHTIIDGYYLYFDGSGIQLFASYIKWFLLSIITLGIYIFWLRLKIKKWVTKHTHLELARYYR